jgi:hypothetical protein
VSRAVEYLDEAIEEAEAAALWYAERSSSAATGFADEVDAAVAAIEPNPDAWPPYDHGTRHYLLRRYPFSLVYRIEETRRSRACSDPESRRGDPACRRGLRMRGLGALPDQALDG